MIHWIPLFTATVWVDFAVIVLSKLIPLTNSLSVWYAKFGMAAVGADVLIIVLGISLAKLLFPFASGWLLVQLSVLIQLIHDVLFYGIIQAVPSGQNQMIDIFKTYAAEGGWKILAADSAMVASSVLLMEWLEGWQWTEFLGILAVYSLLYIVYTK
jgi:hypothetical protein